MKGKIESWFEDKGLVPTKMQLDYIRSLDRGEVAQMNGGRLSGKSWLMGQLVEYYQQQEHRTVRVFERILWDGYAEVPHELPHINGDPVPAPQRRIDVRVSDTITDIYTAWEWDERVVWSMWVGFDWR